MDRRLVFVRVPLAFTRLPLFRQAVRAKVTHHARVSPNVLPWFIGDRDKGHDDPTVSRCTRAQAPGVGFGDLLLLPLPSRRFIGRWALAPALKGFEQVLRS